MREDLRRHALAGRGQDRPHLRRRRLRQVDARRVPQGGCAKQDRHRRRRDLWRRRCRHDCAAHQDPHHTRRAGRAQRGIRPGTGDRHQELPADRHDGSPVPVPRRRVEGVREALRRSRRGRSPSSRRAARGREPRRQRPAEEGGGRLQARIRRPLQVRGVDLRRSCLRRPDARGRGDEAGRLHRQGEGARCPGSNARLHGDGGRSEHVLAGPHGTRPHGRAALWRRE